MNPLQKIKFKFEEQDCEALTQKIGTHVWIYFQGKTYSLPVLDQSPKSRRKSEMSAGASNSILAPMPGKITKVLFSEGQSVEVGKVVIVMEAMKMEYTLKSEIKSKIKKVLVKIGDQVSLGQVLIEFVNTEKEEAKK